MPLGLAHPCPCLQGQFYCVAVLLSAAASEELGQPRPASAAGGEEQGEASFLYHVAGATSLSFSHPQGQLTFVPANGASSILLPK